jgi:hypothetical protein
MSDLFETTPENVVMHLKKVFIDGELGEAATAKDFSVVQTEGKNMLTEPTASAGFLNPS